MPSWLTVKPLLVALAAVLAFAGMQTVRLSWAQADGARAGKAFADANFASAQAALASERAARATEQRQREALAGVAAIYEQEKADVEAHAASVAAGLRDGTVSLRRAWAGCESARLSADAGTIAAVAEQDRLRRESLQRVLGWVGQLQAERNECVDGWAAVTGASQ